MTNDCQHDLTENCWLCNSRLWPTDRDLLEWLQGQIVDTIYLDDGRIIDVKGGDVRKAIAQRAKGSK